MSKWDKLLARVLGGTADANIAFDDLRGLLRRLGFSERISGSHHNFRWPDGKVAINLQAHGAQCKPYQVKQVREALQQLGVAEDV